MKAGRMFLSPYHISKGYPINIKSRDTCQSMFHQNHCIITHVINSQCSITFPITNTLYNVTVLIKPAQLHVLQAFMYDHKEEVEEFIAM